MSTTATMNAGSTAAGLPPILSLHHSAFRIVDAEETRKFYEDIVGLPLEAACIFDDAGLGVKLDYMHLFHRMADGDFAAFFDVPDWINPELFAPYADTGIRSGFTVRNEAEFEALQKRLRDGGVEFSGPVDHGFMKSILCKDPSGLPVEFVVKSARYDEILQEEKAKAHDNLKAWTAKLAAAH